MLMLLSGCVVTASSGSRTEYEDKMRIIERDYKEKKITNEEYTQLKNRANQQGKVDQKNNSMSSEQSSP